MPGPSSTSDCSSVGHPALSGRGGTGAQGARHLAGCTGERLSGKRPVPSAGRAQGGCRVPMARLARAIRTEPATRPSERRRPRGRGPRSPGTPTPAPNPLWPGRPADRPWGESRRGVTDASGGAPRPVGRPRAAGCHPALVLRRCSDRPRTIESTARCTDRGDPDVVCRRGLAARRRSPCRRCPGCRRPRGSGRPASGRLG